MPRLPHNALKKEEKSTIVDDDIPAYCIVGQLCEPYKAPVVLKNRVEQLLVTGVMRNTQASDVLCPNVEDVLKKD